jgi:hypothetical protein
MGLHCKEMDEREKYLVAIAIFGSGILTIAGSATK